jgi:hypothetical protein
MTHELSSPELVELVQRVFQPGPEDCALAILVDLPDEVLADTDAWRARRQMAVDWLHKINLESRHWHPRAHLFFYRNVHRNNAELPAEACCYQGGPIPDHIGQLSSQTAQSFVDIWSSHSLVMAPTELSATAPLKLAAKKHRLRAATMPGFAPSMIPALRLDYLEINRRVCQIKALLDRATKAEIHFRTVAAQSHHLQLDLRYRTAHASGGLFHQPGIAGNLPSGEAYIVPYEGEVADEISLSQGELPVQLDEEIVVYRIEQNRAREVCGRGPQAKAEAKLLADEPAYGNIAELGIGVLADFGVEPTGDLLLDEKLGLHIAFGRSDHFGGQVGPSQFSCPDAVVHLDRVYLRAVQPQISIVEMTLHFSDLPPLLLFDHDRPVFDY